MINAATLQLRVVQVRRIDGVDGPSADTSEVQIDVLDVVSIADTGAMIGDGTVIVPLTDGEGSLELIAGTSARFRIRGLPEGDRIVTVPAGTTPIGLDELPEATE